MSALTTTAKVRDYKGITSLDSDAILGAFVESSSAWVLSQLGRPILAATYTETRDGNGKARMLLDQCPPTSDSPPITVMSVTVDGVAVPARPAVSSSATDPDGWVLRDYGVDLRGYTFTRGSRNVVIVYTVGYQSISTATIPAAPGPYTVQAPVSWRSDLSVTIGGAAAAKVASSPAAGQYAVSADGLYTFAAANAGAAAVLSFGVCPEDLEQAVIEHAAFKYNRRTNLGQGSSGVAGDSVSYADAGVIAGVNDALDRYRALGVG